VYLADEFYLTAGMAVPGAAHYDGFAQYENGIGMTRSLLDGWRRVIRARTVSGNPGNGRLGSRGLARKDAAMVAHGQASRVSSVTMVCGTLIGPVIRRIGEELEATTGIKVRTVSAQNTFFGPRVNVSGLLTSRDVLDALARDGEGTDLVLLPRYALDYTGSRFLDDATPAEMQQAIGRPVAFASTMAEVLQILGGPLESGVTVANEGVTSNGKSWVDYEGR
jgi:NifB/MoaA-like Fe-S oxidoreductase